MAGVGTSGISDTETDDVMFSSQPVPLKSSSQTDKSSPKPRQSAIYKTLMNIFSDPESPVVQALASSLVKPITESIQTVLNQQLSHLTSRIEKVESESHEKDVKIKSLERDIDELQQYGRRNAVVISGLPESDGENTDSLAIDLAREKLKVHLEPHEISRSHRLGPPRIGNSKPRNIVVKLATYIRKRLYDARRSLISTGIFISEHLTKYRGDLFYEARQLQKRGRVKHAWTSDGRILVRDHSGKAFLIQSKVDLTQFMETA